jgi:hypothetical protein
MTKKKANCKIPRYYIKTITTYLDCEKDTGVKNLLASSNLQAIYISGTRCFDNMLERVKQI